MAKILVVDDERVLVKGITFNLKNEGYQVETGYDGEEAVELAREGNFDLIILDLMMPKIDGLQACMRIREFSNVPVIMLTAKGEDADKIMGFECGADDYITKPFRIRELTSRIRSVLRRAGQGGSTLMEFGPVQINAALGKVYKNGQDVFLSALEYRLLMTLANHAGQVLSRNQLLESIWDVSGDFVNDNTLTVYIKRLREKIEDDPQNPVVIETVRGLGYRVGGRR